MKDFIESPDSVISLEYACKFPRIISMYVDILHIHTYFLNQQRGAAGVLRELLRTLISGGLLVGGTVAAMAAAGRNLPEHASSQKLSAGLNGVAKGTKPPMRAA